MYRYHDMFHDAIAIGFHDWFHDWICFTICLFISPELDGQRAPKTICFTICSMDYKVRPAYKSHKHLRARKGQEGPRPRVDSPV
jgi:hypothetical protein